MIRIRRSGDIDILIRTLERPAELLGKIGAQALRNAQRAFREQRRGSFAWPDRMVPNVPGIVRDLNAGSNPKARRFQPRPAVIDTGQLRRSLNFRVTGNSVVVGTAVPYAATQNEGGPSVVTLSSSGRERLSALMKRARGAGRRRVRSEATLRARIAFSVDEGVQGALRSKLAASRGRDARDKAILGLGWLFRKPTFTVNVRKRPFLLVTNDDRAKIIRLVEREVARQGRRRGGV